MEKVFISKEGKPELVQLSSWITIKNNYLNLDEVQSILLNEVEGGVFINFKGGGIIIFGMEFIAGRVSRERVITREEYKMIKAYLEQNLGAARII
jgi:hypothetical protein